MTSSNLGTPNFSSPPDSAASNGANFSNEGIEDLAAKAQTSTASTSATPTTPVVPTSPAMAPTPPEPPRELGKIQDELIFRPLNDIKNELFDIRKWLGVPPPAEDPVQANKRKIIHQKWQQLSAAEQQIAAQNFQRDMQHMQEIHEQALAPKQNEVAQEGTSTGNRSSAQAAANKISDDRQKLGGPASAN